jgi:hypothetical protein
MIKKLILSFIILIVIFIVLVAVKAFHQTYKYWNAYYETGKTSVIKLDKKYVAETGTVTFKTILNIPEEHYYCRVGTLSFFIVATNAQKAIGDIIADKKCIVSLKNDKQTEELSGALSDILSKYKLTKIGYEAGKIAYPKNALSFAARTKEIIIGYQIGENDITISLYPVNKKDAEKLQVSLFFNPSTEKAARFVPMMESICYLLLLSFLVYLGISFFNPSRRTGSVR